MSVFFSPEADVDFANAIEYLAERNRNAATAMETSTMRATTIRTVLLTTISGSTLAQW